MSDLSRTRTVLCRYRYDALDRLTGVDTGAAEPVWRFYQKSRLSVEIQGALRRSVFQFEDQLLAEHRLSGSTGWSDLLGTDGQRSVLHTQGSQGQQSIGYSAYGHCPPADVLPGFNGERRDPLTGHYLLGNGYRAYNPVLMRFNQPDSLSPFGRGGLNAYAYCQGDPVNRRDPSGHISGFRVPGLTMFPLMTLQDLPELALGSIFKELHGKDLVTLSHVSQRMYRHVDALAIIPRVNADDPLAILKVRRDVRGWSKGVSPIKLKGDAGSGYRAGFEKAVRSKQQKFAEWSAHNDRQAQAVIERQLNAIADAEVSPENAFQVVYENHNRFLRMSEETGLLRAQYARHEKQHSDLMAVADKIRSRF